MSGKYLLDTNIVIALFANDPSVQKHIARAGEIFISSRLSSMFKLFTLHYSHFTNRANQ